MEKRLDDLEAIVKKVYIFGFIIIVLLIFLTVRIEMSAQKTSKIEKTLIGFISDDYKLKAAEIIDWNKEKEMSAVEIYKEWEERSWMSSIGELKHCLSSEIGRQILIDHFGEKEIIELEEAIGATKED